MDLCESMDMKQESELVTSDPPDLEVLEVLQQDEAPTQENHQSVSSTFSKTDSNLSRKLSALGIDKNILGGAKKKNIKLLESSISRLKESLKNIEKNKTKFDKGPLTQRNEMK